MIFDDLAQQYFTSPEGFATGLKLLQKYREAESKYPNFADMEGNFLTQLDDDDVKILEKAIDYSDAMSLHNGNNPYTPNTSQISSTIPLNGPSANIINSISLNKAINDFILEKKQNWIADNDSEMKYRDEIFPLFIEINGNINTGDLSFSHSTAFKNVIFKYPKNRRKIKEFRELSLDEILERDIPPEKQLGLTTKYKYLERIVVFLKWLEDNGYSAPNIYKPLMIKKNYQTQGYDKKHPYTLDDLKKLFNSNDYVKGEHDKPFKFWVPLICLLAGARVNEICQLLLADIYKDDEFGIFVFNFNKNDSSNTKKSLKKPYHERSVPIHEQLIRLGLIEYVEYLRSKNEVRLFPELRYLGVKGKYAGTAIKWFNVTYTNNKNCNIITPKTSLHSLRHNISDYFSKTLNLVETKYVYALGQTPKGGVSVTNYVTPEKLPELHKTFNKVDFSDTIDFSKIRTWKLQAFYKK